MRVLFISSSRLGDAILSTSVLHHLEKKYPNLEVSVVSGKLPAPLFTSIPFCTQHYILEKKSYARHWVNLWKHFRKDAFDMIIDLRGSLVSFGIPSKKRFIWKSHILPKGHQVERFATLLGLEAPLPPKLWIHGKSLEKVKKDLAEDFLAISPAANWMGKQWPAEHFINLLKDFQERFPESPVVLFAAPHEEHVVKSITKKLNPSMTHAVLTSDLHYVTAALSRAKVFLGNDSGLMHMAAALGIPTMGLFGPSDNRRYGPYGKDHVIIREKSLTDIEATPQFSYSGDTCYMHDIDVVSVRNPLFNMWQNHSEQLPCIKMATPVSM